MKAKLFTALIASSLLLAGCSNAPKQGEKSYEVSFDSTEHFSAEGLKEGGYKAGETVSLTLTPDAGYQLDPSASYTTKQGETPLETTYVASVLSFKMPKANVTVKAGARLANYSIELETSDKYTCFTKLDEKHYEEQVVLVLTMADGYALSACTVQAKSNVGTTEYVESSIQAFEGVVYNVSFTMPNEDVVVTPTVVDVTYQLSDFVTFDSEMVESVTFRNEGYNVVTEGVRGTTYIIEAKLKEGYDLVSITNEGTAIEPTFTGDYKFTLSATTALVVTAVKLNKISYTGEVTVTGVSGVKTKDGVLYVANGATECVVKITANPGYETNKSSISVANATISGLSSDDGVFTVAFNNITGDVTINVVTSEIVSGYTLSFTAQSGIVVKVNGTAVSSPFVAQEGDTVVISCTDDDYYFFSVTASVAVFNGSTKSGDKDIEEGETASFTMPAQNVSLTFSLD